MTSHQWGPPAPLVGALRFLALFFTALATQAAFARHRINLNSGRHSNLHGCFNWNLRPTDLHAHADGKPDYCQRHIHHRADAGHIRFGGRARDRSSAVQTLATM